MHCLCRISEPAQALRHYRRLRHHLHEELGVGPAPGADALVAEITNNRSSNSAGEL